MSKLGKWQAIERGFDLCSVNRLETLTVGTFHPKPVRDL